MAVHRGANVACSDASTGGFVAVWGRSPGSVVDVVGGSLVVVVVVVVLGVAVGPSPAGVGDDPQLERTTPAKTAPATTTPGDHQGARDRC
jgi:hypothetical protein